MKIMLPLVFALALIGLASQSWAEATRYTGSGIIVRDELTMKMADGTTVFTARSQGVATISTEPPVILGVKCMGLGSIATAEDQVMHSDVRCTFRAGEQDAFDITALTNKDGGVISITGGSGRWNGAKGVGGFTLEELTTEGTRFTFELNMDMPEG